MPSVNTILSASAIAAVIVAASLPAAASAQTPVEVVEEATQVHCNPCLMHEAGEIGMETHLFGSEQVQLRCEMEFDAELYESALGSLHNQALFDHGGIICARRACAPPAETEWDIQSPAEEIGPGTISFPLEFCLERTDGGSQIHCTVAVAATEPVTHQWEFETHDDCDGSGLEVDGHWDGEGAALEAIHL